MQFHTLLERQKLTISTRLSSGQSGYETKYTYGLRDYAFSLCPLILVAIIDHLCEILQRQVKINFCRRPKLMLPQLFDALTL
jgi:hypothetical protein